MMGAGKSCVGEALARRLGRNFVDSDAEIERLERTPRIEQAQAEHFDLYRVWVLAALLLFSCAQLSRHTWARRTP